MSARPLRIEPIKTLHEFTVRGKGQFPIDMLRYDRCWPKSEGRDVVALLSPEKEPRDVTLVGVNTPTEGRWVSFGWQVL